LHDQVWAPIGQALPTQTKRIIISPDGQLNFISFATLLTHILERWNAKQKQPSWGLRATQKALNCRKTAGEADLHSSG
jgi:hypothetical protein